MSKENNFILKQTDALIFLQNIETNSVDLLITDPPYESLEKYRAIGTTTRLKQSKASNNIWFEIFPNSRFEILFSEIYRVLKNNSHFYLFCDQETAFFAKPIAEQIGFKFWKPLVWDKKTIGMGYHYRSRYEFILFFEKGKLKLNNLGTADILEAHRIRNGYPTEKPVSVLKTLILQSSKKGGLVVDPFMGSGSTGQAALESERLFLGCDLSLFAYDMAKKRLEDYSTKGSEEINLNLFPERPSERTPSKSKSDS